MPNYTFSFGKAEFLAHYAVVTVSAGIHITKQHVDEYHIACQEIFHGKPHASIAHNINLHTMDVECFHYLYQKTNLHSMAIVCQDKLQFYRAEASRSNIDFMKIMITTSFDDAVSWINLQTKKFHH